MSVVHVTPLMIFPPPHQPSDTIAVWAVDPSTGTLTRIQDAMAFGARQIRSFELSPAGTTASAGGQVSPAFIIVLAVDWKRD